MQPFIFILGSFVILFVIFFWMFKADDKRNAIDSKKFHQREREARIKFELSLDVELIKLFDMLDIPKLRNEELRDRVVHQLRIILVNKCIHREIEVQEFKHD